MKKFIPLEQMWNNLRPRRVVTWFDKLNFFHIFLVWTSVVVVFGIAYYALATDNSFLFNNINKSRVTTLLDSVYFSFVTATTTGFGDVVPMQLFKLIAIVQVVFGLLLLAFVTSKLVSIKQDVILDELYDISFNESMYGLRSSLMVFRQNLTRVISRIEDNSIKKRELNDVFIYFSSFEDTLQQIDQLVEPSRGNRFKKVMDPLNAEIIFNSVLQSFEKINEFVTELNKSRLEWKRDITVDLIQKCMALSDSLFAQLKATKIFSEKLLTDLSTQNKALQDKIKAGMNPPAK
jgi:hypothetical protein